jgi:hypothetical protein
LSVIIVWGQSASHTTEAKVGGRSGKPTKPEEAFYLGICYTFSAGILLQRIGTIHGPATDTRPRLCDFPPTMVSGLMLECLAIEIFLKCLLQLESGGPSTRDGHSLVTLFARVSPNVQDRIKQIFNSLDPPSSDPDPNAWSFDEVLNALNLAFVNWRCAYEWGMGRTTFDTRLAYSIQTAILELRPDWSYLTQFAVSPSTVITSTVVAAALQAEVENQIGFWQVTVSTRPVHDGSVGSEPATGK